MSSDSVQSTLSRFFTSKSNFGPYPSTNVILAWINRDVEVDTEEV